MESEREPTPELQRHTSRTHTHTVCASLSLEHSLLMKHFTGFTVLEVCTYDVICQKNVWIMTCFINMPCYGKGDLVSIKCSSALRGRLVHFRQTSVNVWILDEISGVFRSVTSLSPLKMMEKRFGFVTSEGSIENVTERVLKYLNTLQSKILHWQDWPWSGFQSLENPRLGPNMRGTSHGNLSPATPYRAAQEKKSLLNQIEKGGEMEKHIPFRCKCFSPLLHYHLSHSLSPGSSAKQMRRGD